mgnify:CR=1 FL=1
MRRTGLSSTLAALSIDDFTSGSHGAAERPVSNGVKKVEPGDGVAKTLEQQNLTVVVPLLLRAVRGDVGAKERGVSDLGESAQGFLFELVFGHGRFLFKSFSPRIRLYYR